MGATSSSLLGLDKRVLAFSELAEKILILGAYKATKFLDDKLTIKATRKLFKYNNRKIDNRKPVEIIFRVGRPNYEEKELIKKAKKTGEKLEIKLKFPPVKKGS